MDVILVPGLWLDASCWDDVIPALERAGHRARALTLPGLESVDADRSGIGLADHVAAVVAAVDEGAEPVVLVGHSASGGVVHAAVDARPDRVAHAIYVGGFPSPPGRPVAADFRTDAPDIPFPDWSEFDEADLGGLDDAARAAMRARAVPSPGRLSTDVLELSDERRYDVPVTAICPEYTSAMLREWIARDLAPVSEFAKIRTVHFADLPTGHWPQLTRPDHLGRAIDAALHAYGDFTVDDAGRPEPPVDGDEVATLLGFLEFQRATFEWKCGGLDAAALQATTAASDMTLGGMLKHLAYVEESWFTRHLFDRPPAPPWDTVDWSADRDWEWHSAAEDSPEELFALWRAALARSRARVAEALADGGLSRIAAGKWSDGRSPSLRWIVCHMIEEYARHNGHADLLRESIDGATGE